jgi:hypothetical protein
VGVTLGIARAIRGRRAISWDTERTDGQPVK